VGRRAVARELRVRLPFAEALIVKNVLLSIGGPCPRSASREKIGCTRVARAALGQRAEAVAELEASPRGRSARPSQTPINADADKSKTPPVDQRRFALRCERRP
jgi:hypothetical protein